MDFTSKDHQFLNLIIVLSSDKPENSKTRVKSKFPLKSLHKIRSVLHNTCLVAV